MFTQVSSGGFHTCGVKSDDTLACWGQNNYGQATPPVGSFTQVSAGDWHTCGVKINGTLACWGHNVYGQATPPAGEFTQVGTGAYYSCGIKSDGTVACWGNNDYGQATPPTGTFTQVSAGGYHACGIKSDGAIVCWGNNDSGQIMPPAGTFTQISNGGAHTCGITSDGGLTCWGYNDYGQSPRISISPPSLPNGGEGLAYSQILTASDGIPPYSFNLASGDLPPGLALSSDGLLSGMPTVGGMYSFTVQASDSSFPLAGIQDYTLWVNTPPQLDAIGNQQVVEETLLAFTATATDFDPDQTLTFSLDPGAPSGVTITSGGAFTWIPTEAQAPGVYTITVRVTDDGIPALSDFETIQITVDEVNLPPVATDDFFNGTEDIPLLVIVPGVLLNDSDPDIPVQELSAVLESDPSLGELALFADGAFVYTPTLNYNGLVTFTYLVSDGLAWSNTASVTIFISPVNDAPIVDAGSDQTVNEGDLVVFSGSYANSDGPTPTIAWDFGDGVTASGMLTPTHTYADEGIYTVTLVVTDGLGAAGSDWLLVTIDNVAPTLSPLADQSVRVGEVLTVTGFFTDPGLLDAHTLVIAWADGFTDTINLESDVMDFAISHTYAAAATYTATVTLSDDDGGIDTGSFVVTVVPKNHTVWLPLVTKTP